MTFILLRTWRKMDARGKKTCYTVNDGTKIVLYILTISTFPFLEQKKIFTIADVFKTFGKNVDENHYHQAYTQYKTLCDHARYLAKKDTETVFL